MPRISMEIPENVVLRLDERERRSLVITLVDSVTRVGDRFKEALQIDGADDIWAHGKIEGFSNKNSVFANIYMIPKDCRTDEVIAEFGEEVAVTIRKVVKRYTKIDPGIDMPITVTARKHYIERDDKPEASEA